MLDVLVADPPWQFGDALPGKTRGASKRYGCIPTADLCAARGFDFPALGPDAVLFLWMVESMQHEALYVCDTWGFVPKTSLIWIKRTSTGKRHFGMGRTLRAEHERCIVATRGKAAPAVRNVRSTFEAPVREHSQKPDEFYTIVERLYPDARKFELFARTERPGWTQSGDQLGSIRSKMQLQKGTANVDVY